MSGEVLALRVLDFQPQLAVAAAPAAAPALVPASQALRALREVTEPADQSEAAFFTECGRKVQLSISIYANFVSLVGIVLR